MLLVIEFLLPEEKTPRRVFQLAAAYSQREPYHHKVDAQQAPMPDRQREDFVDIHCVGSSVGVVEWNLWDGERGRQKTVVRLLPISSRG